MKHKYGEVIACFPRFPKPICRIFPWLCSPWPWIWHWPRPLCSFRDQDRFLNGTQHFFYPWNGKSEAQKCWPFKKIPKHWNDLEWRGQGQIPGSYWRARKNPKPIVHYFCHLKYAVILEIFGCLILLWPSKIKFCSNLTITSRVI